MQCLLKEKKHPKLPHTLSKFAQNTLQTRKGISTNLRHICFYNLAANIYYPWQIWYQIYKNLIWNQFLSPRYSKRRKWHVNSMSHWSHLVFVPIVNKCVKKKIYKLNKVFKKVRIYKIQFFISLVPTLGRERWIQVWYETKSW